MSKRKKADADDLVVKLAEAMREIRKARKEIAELLSEIEKEPWERIG